MLKPPTRPADRTLQQQYIKFVIENLLWDHAWNNVPEGTEMLTFQEKMSIIDDGVLGVYTL